MVGKCPTNSATTPCILDQALVMPYRERDCGSQVSDLESPLGAGRIREVQAGQAHSCPQANAPHLQARGWGPSGIRGVKEGQTAVKSARDHPSALTASNYTA